MDDRQIIERIRSGDRETFSLLVEKYHRGLLAFIYRLIGDREAVEDIGQEVFLEAYKSLEFFDETRGTPFPAWLFIIARNRCVSELRKRSRAGWTSMEEIGEIDAALKSAEELLIEDERWRAVRASLQGLGEPFKRPFEMSLGGSSLKEIATACGISIGTAKSRLCRAREKMRLLLKEPFGGKRYERI